MKRLLILLVFLIFPSLLHAREGWRDWCQMGNRSVITSGLNSTTKVQQSFPQCTITIYVHGGGKAVIYNDNNGTIKANPFVSDTDGQFIWYADNGRYDQTTTGSGMPQPITMSDILLCDPADAAGGSCGTGGGGGSGCLLPGTDTGVLSEHPVGTCYDSLSYTWDDTLHNLQIGDITTGDSPNTVGANDTWIIGTGALGLGGNNLTGATFAAALGGGNIIQAMGSPAGAGFQANQFMIAIGGGNEIGDSAHANSGGNNIIAVGEEGFVMNASWVSVFGPSGVGVNGGTGYEQYGFVVGGAVIANCVQSGVCGSTGNGIVQNFGVVGDSNTLNRNGTGTIDNVYMGGFTNRIDTTLGNVTGGSEIWGFDNEIDGAIGNDVLIYGASNTSHNSHTNLGAICYGAEDSTIAGNLNNISDSSKFQVFGAANTVTTHTCVAIFGMDITAAADNTAYYGMSPTAGMTISTDGTRDTVTFAATAFANLGTPANGSFKYCNNCTIANPCNSGGTGAFAKRLNGVWVCN